MNAGLAGWLNAAPVDGQTPAPPCRHAAAHPHPHACRRWLHAGWDGNMGTWEGQAGGRGERAGGRACLWLWCGVVALEDE